MNRTKIGVVAMPFALVAALPAAALAADACSMLTTAEIEAAMIAKVTKTVPSSVPPETGCVYLLGRDKVTLSYFTDSVNGPKMSSVKDDPFMRGLSGPNFKDYGNVACKITTVGTLNSTNCNHYQPRLLRISAQTRDRPPIAMDEVKVLLERAATRF